MKRHSQVVFWIAIYGFLNADMQIITTLQLYLDLRLVLKQHK